MGVSGSSLEIDYPGAQTTCTWKEELGKSILPCSLLEDEFRSTLLKVPNVLEENWMPKLTAVRRWDLTRDK